MTFNNDCRIDDHCRLAGLRRFAIAITFLNIIGHLFLGFEQSYAQPFAGVGAAYIVEFLLEFIDAKISNRPPRYRGNWRTRVDFFLSAHISGLACAMLMYCNNRLGPVMFAAATAIASKSLFRIRHDNRYCHFLNPSNFGISATLILFPWVGIVPPYQFTENLTGWADWLLPCIFICTGSLLNTFCTRRMPLIAGWLIGFVAQAVIRSIVFESPIRANLSIMTGPAFILYTFYMITDPATTPAGIRRQFLFGLAVAAMYSLLVNLHIVFAMYFGLTIVTALRGIGIGIVNRLRQDDDIKREGSELVNRRRSVFPEIAVGRMLLGLIVLWISLITVAHGWMNQNWFRTQERNENMKPLEIGYLPVTCHLTCPVAHFINLNSQREEFCVPRRFQGWPEVKETLLAEHIQVTFLLAPMAIKLREQGVPIKIVYLGHRDGSAMMVHKDSEIHSIEQLRGKTIAVPNRFSNQCFLIFKALKDRGISLADVKLVEMPPPDMPVALATRAVDAITSGEPFMAQTELSGYGRILYLTKDVWPNFISCVLVVRENAIHDDRRRVQKLVDGIAKSGKWLDESLDHRMQAAHFVAKNYFNQDPKLTRFVLSKPIDRVKYTNLVVRKDDFEEIARLGKELGVLDGTAQFDDYADTSFVDDDEIVKPYTFRYEVPEE